MYVVPLQVNYERESFLDKVTITPQQVYDRFSEEIPTTSTPTPAIAREVLQRVVDDGYEQAVIVTISSGLSATCELMRSITVGMPELDCCIVDTKNIGMGAGLVALAAKGRRQSLKKAMRCAEEAAARYPRCTMAVVNGDAAAEAAEVKHELEQRVHNVDAWYEGQISPVLVVHTGPGLIGIGVCGA